MRNRFLLAASLALMLTGCDAAPTPTAAPVTASSLAAEGSGEFGSTTSQVDASDLVEAGCLAFDPDELGRLTGLAIPLAPIQEDSTPVQLSCSFIGTANDVSASVRIEVKPLDSRPPGYFRTPGEFESPLEISGLSAVGTGRGSLRAELGDLGGLILNVEVSALTSDAASISDGQYLAIRDAVAAYVVTALS